MYLDRFDNRSFSRGRSLWTEALWLFLQTLFIRSWLPGAAHRKTLLRLFGAKIGKGVNIKPGVKVKFPWYLTVGDNSWIGEDAWIDNLAPVTVGNHCCISQEVYLCTGNHDHSKETFDLIAKPIVVKDHAWLCARATVGPGVSVGEGAVLSLGSTASHDLEAWCIYQGNPAVAVKKRRWGGGTVER